MTKAAWLAAGLLFAACGDNTNVNPDVDAPPVPDAPPDSPSPDPFVKPTPFEVPLSAAGPDQLQSATAAPDGKFYAAGFAAQTVAGAKVVVVVKYGTTGPDTTFGTNGVATTALEFAGGTGEIGIATQADGKILVSATIASAVDPLDRDLGVVRLLADGTTDVTFGVAGIAKVNLNDALINGTTVTGADASRGIAVDANGIYLNGVSRGLGNNAAGAPRTDTDFTVVRLTSAGVVDPTFATAGQFRLDIQESNATARGIKLMPDGKIMTAGYANSPGVGTVQPVIIRLTTTGAIDTGFATGGVFHEAIFAIQTEVYNFALHDTFFTTGGYGRDAGTTNDYISLKFDLATGARDTTYGTVHGAAFFDPSGTMVGSNCRNAIAMPGGKTLLTGSTGPGNMPAQDAVFAILTDTGALDTEYLTGVHVFKLGADGNDQFWGAAVSGDHVMVVGYKGGGPAAMQTDVQNDDSFGVVFKLR